MNRPETHFCSIRLGENCHHIQSQLSLQRHFCNFCRSIFGSAILAITMLIEGHAWHCAVIFMDLFLAILSIVFIFLVLVDGFEAMVLPRRVTRRFRFARLFYRYSWRLWRTLAG